MLLAVELGLVVAMLVVVRFCVGLVALVTICSILLVEGVFWVQLLVAVEVGLVAVEVGLVVAVVMWDYGGSSGCRGGSCGFYSGCGGGLCRL